MNLFLVKVKVHRLMFNLLKLWLIVHECVVHLLGIVGQKKSVKCERKHVNGHIAAPLSEH